MSLKDRIDAGHVNRSRTRFKFMDAMLSRDPELMLEMIELVEEWAAGKGGSTGYKSKTATARLLSRDEQVRQYPFSSQSIMAEWLTNAEQGTFDFESAKAEARAAIAARQPEVASRPKAKRAAEKPATRRKL